MAGTKNSVLIHAPEALAQVLADSISSLEAPLIRLKNFSDIERAVQTDGVSVVILDLRAEADPGVGFLQKLRIQKPRPIALVIAADPSTRLNALRAGALETFEDPVDPDSLVRFIKIAAELQDLIEDPTAMTTTRSLIESAANRLSQLSKLETGSPFPSELSRVLFLLESGKGPTPADELREPVRLLNDGVAGLRVFPDLGTPSLLARLEEALVQVSGILGKSVPQKQEMDRLAEGAAAFHAAVNEGIQAHLEADGSPMHSVEVRTIRIGTDRIDSVMDLIGELVVIKSQLMHHDAIAASADLQLNSLSSLLDQTVRELQDKALSMRMTSLQGLFRKMERVTRDLSMRLGKPVEFSMTGQDTELDKGMIDLLTDPLMHMVRNAIDHGIENRELRLQRRKPESGSVSVSAKQTGRNVVLILQDDGAGIDRKAVLAEARRRGIESELSSDEDLLKLLFQPGFSTCGRASDVSGRGIGLDVVNTQIERLNGSIEIQSKPGEGTTIRLTIPQTTSVTDGMLISVRSQRFLVPLATVRELIHIKSVECSRLSDGSEVIRIREEMYPLIRIEETLKGIQDSNTSNDGGIILLLESVNGTVGLKVDAVLGQTQVVLKPFTGHEQVNEGISGAAIMGDGRIALLLDIDALARKAESEALRAS